MAAKRVQKEQAPRQRVLPVQERSRRKIDTILDATAALLAHKGVEAVSMLAIAEAAAMPAATVYHYFESRLAVLAALAERTMVAVDTQLQQHMQQLQQQDFSVRELLQALYQAYREAPGYVVILRALRAEPVFEGLVQESNRRGADMVVSLLAKRTRLSRVRAARIARILSEFCEQILQAALMAEPREAKALLDELTEMVDVLFQHYQEKT